MKTALIDIGTNSVRYLAVRLAPGGGAALLQRGLAVPRLGAGAAGEGLLGAAAVARTISELARIKVRLDRSGVVRYRAVGTEALRLAANRSEFLRRAAEIGIEVEVISGEEEARLIRRGTLSGFPSGLREPILADIGAGSTEIIPAGEGVGEAAASLPLGCLRLQEMFSPGRDPDPGERERMEGYCRAVLRKIASGISGSSLVGLGGTFTTLAAIRLGLESYDGDLVHGRQLDRGEIEEIYLRLVGLSLARRERVAGLEPSRADIIIPGAIIVRAIMDVLGRTRVAVSDRGLLFGLLAEETERRGLKES